MATGLNPRQRLGAAAVGASMLAFGIVSTIVIQMQEISFVANWRPLATAITIAISLLGLAFMGGAILTSVESPKKVLASLASIVAVLLISIGIAFSLTDRPGPYRQVGYYNFPAWCEPNTNLDVKKFETYVTQKGSSGVEVLVYFYARAVGPGRCIAALDIPRGASNVKTDMIRVQGSSQEQAAAVFSVTADPLGERHYISYRSNGQSAGYGNVNISLDITPVQRIVPNILPGSDSFSTANLVDSMGYIRIDCIDRNTLPAFPFPQDGQEISPGHVAWRTTANGKGVGAHCVNTYERYWVNHVTDLIVLGVGAILGALLVLDWTPRASRR